MKTKKHTKKVYFFAYALSGLIALYFIITSNLFLSKVVLPGIGLLIDTDFTAKHVEYNPFTSYVEAHDVTLGSRDNPFITGKSVHFYLDLYSLFSLTLKFEDGHVDGVNINFVRGKNNKWSLPWIYIDYPDGDFRKVGLDFPNFSIKNMNIRFHDEIGKSNEPLDIELKNINLKCDHFKNGLLSPLKYKGNITIKTKNNVNIQNGKISGILAAKLDAYCIPAQIKISNLITDLKGKINNQNALIKKSSFNLEVNRQDNDMNKYSINTAYNDFSDKDLTSKLNTDGKLNFYPFKLNLEIEAKNIHSNMLHIINSLGHYDTGPKASLNYSGTLNAGNNNLRSSGNIFLSDSTFSAGKYKFIYKPLDFFFGYDFNFNSENNVFSCRKLDSFLSDNNKKLITVKLKKAFDFYYGQKNSTNTGAGQQPVINIYSNSISLNMLNSFLPNKVKAVSGDLNTNLEMSILPGTGNITLKGNINTENAVLNIDDDIVKNLGIKQSINLSIQDVFDKFILNNYTLELQKQSKKFSKFMISGEYNSTTHKGSLKTKVPYTTNKIIDIIPEFSKEFSYLAVLIQKTSPLNFKFTNDIDFSTYPQKIFNIKTFDLSVTNPEEKKNIEFKLVTPFAFLFDTNHFSINNEIKLKATGSTVSLKKVAGLFPKDFPLRPTNGYLHYQLLFIVPETLNSMKVQGIAKLLYADLNIYGKTIKGLSVANHINAEFKHNKYLKFKDTSIELYAEGVLGLESKLNGTISFNNHKSSHLVVSINNINKYLFDTLYKGISENINTLNAGGKISIDYKQHDDTTSITGNLNCPTMKFNKVNGIKGNVDFKLTRNSNAFEINKLSMAVSDEEDRPVADLDINANFPLPLANGISTLNLTSANLACRKIIKIYDVLTENIKTLPPPKPGGEIEKIDFDGLYLRSNINLKNITYGGLIKSSFDGKLDIKNNIISLYQAEFNLNGAKITTRADIAANYTNGVPYHLHVSTKNLDLKPIIYTCLSKPTEKDKGKLDSFNLILQGKGFCRKNLEQHFFGSLDAKLSDLSLPAQINEFKLLKITLIPLEVLSKIRDMLPGGLLIHNLAKGIQSAQDIFKNLDNINLSKGDIKLQAKNGKINLSNIHFVGTKNSAVRYSLFSGTIDFDKKLNIKSNSDISGLRLPFHITGTIDNPSPNITEFLPKFIALNTMHILNPMNIIDLFVDTYTGATTTIEGSAAFIENTISKPFTSEKPK